MLKFNNNNIFTGYLKQVLKSFNLPRYRVYSKYDEENNDAFIVPSYLPEYTTDGKDIAVYELLNPYIKDEKIMYYFVNESTGITWSSLPKDFNASKTIDLNNVNTKTFIENKKELNNTRNLIIKNNIYDSYTHEYLGDYLRFFRDYHNYDLMPLYNCFSNRICNKLDLFWYISNTTTKKYFKSEEQYKIYMIPVKLFRDYTIAIDCSAPVEMCCAIYGEYQNENESNKTIAKYTYMHYNSIRFNDPILYSKLTELAKSSTTETTIKKFLIKNADDLKLFIKIPINNRSSVTVLEGKYLNYNDATFSSTDGLLVRKQNRYVTNFEYEESFDTFKPITSLQLLQLNTGESYPFADRLIEYLTDNVISDLDPNEDNIARVQAVLNSNVINKSIFKKYTGVWQPAIRPILYDYMNKSKDTAKFDINKDILGYVDKDVEKFYTGANKTTISSVDIYEED